MSAAARSISSKTTDSSLTLRQNLKKEKKRKQVSGGKIRTEKANEGMPIDLLFISLGVNYDRCFHNGKDGLRK